MKPPRTRHLLADGAASCGQLPARETGLLLLPSVRLQPYLQHGGQIGHAQPWAGHACGGEVDVGNGEKVQRLEDLPRSYSHK